MKKFKLWLIANLILIPNMACADRGAFDIDRWYQMLDSVRNQAISAGVSKKTVDASLKYTAVIPSIIKSDASQSEFTLTLDEYLGRMVNQTRVQDGIRMRKKYPTMLKRVDAKFGVPPHVIMAFWGMESNYGTTKARHKLIDAFLTLIYEGRREQFFTNQLIALMKIADKNKLDINDIGGSWAGAMGHFQFIPTTLAQYGTDGNGDKRVDIINSVGDAMFSAGNYLNKLGWNKNERIVRRVVLPGDFDISLLDGKTKMSLPEWTAMGVVNPDGTPIPNSQIVAGLVADVKHIENTRTKIAADNDAAIAAAQAQFLAQNPGVNVQNFDVSANVVIKQLPPIHAYLTYPNFYRIKKWNNSNWYAIAIAELADKLK